jgi:hypothetical protein
VRRDSTSMPEQAVGEEELAVSRSHTTDAGLRLRCNTMRRWDPGFARGRWVADPAFRYFDNKLCRGRGEDEVKPAVRRVARAALAAESVLTVTSQGN